MSGRESPGRSSFSSEDTSLTRLGLRPSDLLFNLNNFLKALSLSMVTFGDGAWTQDSGGMGLRITIQSIPEFISFQDTQKTSLLPSRACALWPVTLRL